MAKRLSPREPKLPLPLRKLGTEEYTPPPHDPKNLPAIGRVRTQGPDSAARLSLSLEDYWVTRQGTAAALRELDKAWGGGFYSVPEEAILDREAADAALGGEQLVIDVQTHYVSDRPSATEFALKNLVSMAKVVAGDRFTGLHKLRYSQHEAGYAFAQYLRCVFLESETDIAVLTSGPGAEGQDPDRNLDNPEMRGTRELIERLDGTGRLINHSTVHPNVPGDLDKMDRWSEWCVPAGWKCYTMYGAQGRSGKQFSAWSLDDEGSGLPFLYRVRETAAPIVCVHKGLTNVPDYGWDGPSSPRDIGPAAKGFPDINFLVYHSGYEVREGDLEEGPYSEEVSHQGTNRLIKSLKDAGVGPGGNVYAELGSTWYQLMANPREAAHVIGKLLLALGEDNILWGTDAIWYGSPQPLIDAFRAFHIPDEYLDHHGYPQLTATAKEKILGLNAARIYGIDPEKARATVRNDDLAWVKAALAEYSAKGTPFFAG